jgi:hypothetical protein
MGAATQRPLKCSEVEAFAEKLAVALAPLKELIRQEAHSMRGVGAWDLFKQLINHLMEARFGEPDVKEDGEHSFEIEYKCVDEEKGVEAEAGILVLTPCLLMFPGTVYKARSEGELRRLLGVEK